MVSHRERLMFKVEGRAYPQGSKKGFIANGRVVMIEQAGKNLKEWRKNVAEGALQARAVLEVPTLEGHCAVTLEFTFLRPKVHFKTNGKLTDKALFRPANRSTGDIDKLTRAVLDALDTADVFKDDSQVVELTAYTRYAILDEPAQVNIIVEGYREIATMGTQQAKAAQ